MLKPAKKWQASTRARKGGLEISTLAKWIILIVFLILVIIIIVKVRTTGDENISAICAATGGFIGC